MTPDKEQTMGGEERKIGGGTLEDYRRSAREVLNPGERGEESLEWWADAVRCLCDEIERLREGGVEDWLEHWAETVHRHLETLREHNLHVERKHLAMAFNDLVGPFGDYADPAPTTEMNPCASCGWPESAHPVDIDGPGAGQQVVCSTFQDPTPEPERETFDADQHGEPFHYVSDPHTRAEGEDRPYRNLSDDALGQMVEYEFSRQGSFSRQVAREAIRRLRTDPDDGSEGREPVAWLVVNEHGQTLMAKTFKDDAEFYAKKAGGRIEPLYTRPTEEEGDG